VGFFIGFFVRFWAFSGKIPAVNLSPVFFDSWLFVNGSHIDLVVVSPVFAGLTPVKKQQLVLGTLSQQFADGTIHAVDFVKTFTPEQWQQQQ
jgi:acid stress-induced BolA-like protein IbaG/YrbA